MEQTSSLTADSEWSPGSRVTVSLVRPIWSRKETPWTEPREFDRLGPVWLPLESRLQSVAGGLGDGDGVGGAVGWGKAEKDRAEATDGGLSLADIGCYLGRRADSRNASNGNDIQKEKKTSNFKKCLRLVSQTFSVLESHLSQLKILKTSHRLEALKQKPTV